MVNNNGLCYSELVLLRDYLERANEFQFIFIKRFRLSKGVTEKMGSTGRKKTLWFDNYHSICKKEEEFTHK